MNSRRSCCVQLEQLRRRPRARGRRRSHGQVRSFISRTTRQRQPQHLDGVGFELRMEHERHGGSVAVPPGGYKGPRAGSADLARRPPEIDRAGRAERVGERLAALGGPVAHAELVRHDAGARAELLGQDRPQLQVRRRQQIERDDGGGRDVDGQRVLQPELDQVLDAGLLSRWPSIRAIRSGSMSTPTPCAPYFLAAVMTVRPSPHPRS